MKYYTFVEAAPAEIFCNRADALWQYKNALGAAGAVSADASNAELHPLQRAHQRRRHRRHRIAVRKDQTDCLIMHRFDQIEHCDFRGAAQQIEESMRHDAGPFAMPQMGTD